MTSPSDDSDSAMDSTPWAAGVGLREALGHSAGPWWRGWVCAARSCAADGDVGVAGWWGPYGLFEQSVEQQSGFAGLAPIEPELELAQVLLEMLGFSSSLQGSFEPTFDLGLHAGDGREQHVRGGARATHRDAVVLEAVH